MTTLQVNDTAAGIPYLPTVEWYAAWFRSQLEGHTHPLPKVQPNKTVIRGAWGEQTLTVPIEGGRKRMARTPYARLRLSEHGEWRHTHWQAITSAYGALPYFHYFEHEFAPIYTTGPIATLQELCQQVHQALLRCSNLNELAIWLRNNPTEIPDPQKARKSTIPRHISAIELLFLRGPETVFTLLQ